MSDKLHPISFSVYGQLAAAEQEHANAVQATVSGIVDEAALRQWASCKAAAVRASSSANADELRFILDVVDRAAVLRLPPDAAAALSWRCRTAARNALAGPGADDVRMLRACLAALDSVSDTPPPATATGTQPAEGGKPKPAGRRNRGRGKNIDARMLKAISENREAIGWSVRQWAEHLECQISTVAETRTWKEHLAKYRDAQRVDRAERSLRRRT
jgi:hypothetical protein